MVLLLAAVNIVFGLVFGLNVGFVAPFMEFKSRNDNCLNNEDATACQNNDHVDCQWRNNTCLFSDLINCAVYTTSDKCNANAKCLWDFTDNGSCKHQSGWQSWQKGFFSGSMIIGAMFGSFMAGGLLDKYGRKRVLGLIGVITFLGALGMSAARGYDSYELMIIARIIVGVGVGATCVASPLYVGEMAPPESKGTLGVMFQLGVTFGIVILAFLAFVLAPPNGRGLQHWEERIQLGLIAPCLIFSALSVVLATLIKESTVWQRKENEGIEAHSLIAETEVAAWTWDEVRRPLLVAVVLSFATQMTGINAIMNYAPSITKAAGLEPLTGNFVVMLWNCVTSAISIPVASRFDRRSMYLGGITLCTIACFLTGIPTFPGLISSDTTRHVLASIGIAVFILAFEVGMGPVFFILATELFPPSFTQLGSSFTNTVQLTFNCIINFGFPVAVEGLSGGPGGNQDKGMAIVFMIFGAIGFVGVFILFKELRPWSSTTE